jgi:hypothetical protein
MVPLSDNSVAEGEQNFAEQVALSATLPSQP